MIRFDNVTKTYDQQTHPALDAVSLDVRYRSGTRHPEGATIQLTEPALITVQLRDLDSLPEPEQQKVRELQRNYVRVWVDVLRQVRPELPRDTARAAVHAVFGLINSTPFSGRLETPAMSELLHRMAMGALAEADC